ncbi:exopolysaccharide biosynthesis polyprenyl glycosylphosphotransferase [Microbacteriaceae bacterium SG_E_30_P1]|uniref:Exopolysaccharide biosynthesis polyprenyl glycosylphosphotransferase n=1 Tax=Antiquaquibacter oligotrophicus TaxID=2880260 RepID=A0ABT6KRF1_9MICO|nr:sugar transferase [Antiquaquibacter oligotrophicus]MDH6181677.1 exopolysaccharide biosynthesis polyprenyl glycosylphosphotransferase [Antiquaquibacter oligotrophicus]
MSSTAQSLGATGVRPISRPERSEWQRSYVRRLIVSDFAVVLGVVFLSQAIWSGYAPGSSGDDPPAWLSYNTISVLLVAAWTALLAFASTRELRHVGAGAAEYRAVVNASLLLLAGVVFTLFVLDLSLDRGPLLTAFALGIVLLLLERWLWRRWLVRQRRQGRMGYRVVLAGSPASVAHLATELRRAPESGYQVVGACVHETGRADAGLAALQIPIIGSLDTIAEAMAEHDADTVAITGTGWLPPQRVRELSWQLEPGRQHLVVAPSLTDIGGPRIRMRPVAGLPLVHVETPKFDRGQKALKRTVDVTASLLLLILLSPLMITLAAVIRLSSPGPILFRQKRVGLDGQLFTMLKFRSMVVDAEARLADLATVERSEGNVVLFKMRNDPRVTPIGRTLRRFSLDELPQLLNVLRGDMSIVGPRPPLAGEVALYEDHVHRRFLMKPGITGLWQVSGRSTLSWEDSVRLDLYYVENWSLTGDLLILVKTVRAVVRREGAY